MATITFNSLEQFAKRLGVRVERNGRKYEVFKESDHGSIGEVSSLLDLFAEIQDFAIGNIVYLDGAREVTIASFDGDDIQVRKSADELETVSPERIESRKTAEANYGYVWTVAGHNYVQSDLTRREAQERIDNLRCSLPIDSKRLIQFLS